MNELLKMQIDFLLAGGFIILVAATVAPKIQQIAVVVLGWALLSIVGMSLLGQPRPSIAWPIKDVGVASMQYVEGEAIWIWTSQSPPVSWRLPWDERLARQGHEHQVRSEETGAPFRMRMKNPGEFQFYEEPQPAPPPKRGQ